MKIQKQIQDYYDGQAPSESFWLDLDESILPIKKSRRSNWARVVSLSLGVAAAVVIGTWWFGLQSFRVSVFEEVATHHLEHKAMDVLERDYDRLSEDLSDFDCDLRSTRSFIGGYDLVGGRYCSLRQRQAIQMRLKHRESGALDTLYVTALKGELSRVSDFQKEIVGDVNLTMWKEDERLFVLASSVSR